MVSISLSLRWDEGDWVSWRRNLESTRKAPVFSLRSTFHVSLSSEGGVLPGIDCRDEGGRWWVLEVVFWTKGFIMLPVLQTHIPIPISPSSFVVMV